MREQSGCLVSGLQSFGFAQSLIEPAWIPAEHVAGETTDKDLAA